MKKTLTTSDFTEISSGFHKIKSTTYFPLFFRLLIFALICSANSISAQTFARPDSATMMTALRATNPGFAHPRLYARAAEFDSLKIKVGTGTGSDANMHTWYTAILANANGQLTQAPYPYSGGFGPTPDTRNLSTRIYNLSMAYKITGDTTYSNRVIREMDTVCNYPDWTWGGGNNLNRGDIEWSFSVGYDWCYEAMTPSERANYRHAMITLGIEPLINTYNANPYDYYYGTGSSGDIFSVSNRNPWCNGAAAVCAMAFADEDSTGYCGTMMSRALVVDELYMNMLNPDGGSVEGPGYGDGAMTFYIEWMAAMKSALDTDYNYFYAPGVPNAAFYPVYLNGPIALLNFHDAGTDAKAYLGVTFYFANKLPNPGLGNMHKNDLLAGYTSPGVFDVIWYNPTLYGAAALSIPLDTFFLGAGGQTSTGSFRSAFNDSNATFLAFHAGENNVSHSHLDIGQFNIDAMGLNWALDFGTEDLTYNTYYHLTYSSPYDLYRLNPGGHNTLLINPSTSFDGQSDPALNLITNFGSAPSGAFSIIDMSKAYQTQASSAKRGFALTGNRSQFIIQDEINLLQPSEVWWNMHTRATLDISADGKTAILNQQGKRMRASIISPANGKFLALDCKPLPDVKQDPYQTPNPGRQNLAIDLLGVKNATIMVELIPIYNDSDLLQPTLPVIPLSQWSEPRIAASSPLLSPTISYKGPQVFTTNTAVTPVTPVNTGGPVPATVYGTVSTAAAAGGQAQGLAFNAASSILYMALNNEQVIDQLTLPSTVSTLAGTTGSLGYTNGTGSAARFNEPFGVAVHPVTGDIYVADAVNNVIRKITTAGVVTTFAGTGTAGSANGYITAATFSSPQALAFDNVGNLFVTQTGGAIRKISTGDTVSTISTAFSDPWGIAYHNGSLYVSDAQTNKISVLTPAGAVTTLAGSGLAGATDAIGTAASFNGPRGIAVDATGNVYVADYSNNKIRMITPGGVVTTVAGSGANAEIDGSGSTAAFRYTAGLTMDTSGNLYVGDPGSGNIREVSVTGYTISPALPAGLVFDPTTGTISGTPVSISAATDYTINAFNKNGSSSTVVNIRVVPVLPPNISYSQAETYLTGAPITPLSPVNTGGAVPATVYANVSTVTNAGGQPQGLAFNIDDSVLYTALTNQDVIKSVTLPSFLSLLAGSAGAYGSTNGTGTAARFSAPSGVAVHPLTGDIYIADADNNTIRKVTATGVVTTFAGTGTAATTDGYISAAAFNSPHALTFDSVGNLYVSQSGDGSIREIFTNDTVITLTTGFNNPCGLAYYNGSLYVSDEGSNNISQVSLKGVVSALAGSGAGGSTDATGIAASFNGPRGIAVDISGNTYVADYNNNKIRKITPGGQVTTIAGSGTNAETDGVGTGAAFESTMGLALDGSGNLYAGDAGSGAIRKIALTGYTISPALPPGLTMDSETGIISGTPTQPSGATDYTVTAYNVSGQSSTIITIRVANLLVPNISYPTPVQYLISTPITPVYPTNTGGAVPATIYGKVTTVASIGGQAQTITYSASSGILYAPLSNIEIVNKMTLPSTVSLLAGLAGTTGTTNGTGSAARFNLPYGIAISPLNGNIFMSDGNNNTIRKITPAGVVTTFAGIDSAETFDLPVPGTEFDAPRGLTFDASGNMFITQGEGYIRKIAADGVTASTVAQGFDNAFAIAAYNKNLYISEVSKSDIVVTNSAGINTILAGNATPGSADGTGAAASFNSPRGVTLDSTGTVYIADYGNNKIRRIDTQGHVVTIAGSGANATTDGTGSAAAFRSPAGITTDGLGNLYVSDAGDAKIRKVVITGYTISPALPAGLSFNGTTGEISGTPTALSPATNYTILAANSQGICKTTLNLAVVSVLTTGVSNTTINTADSATFSYYPNPVSNILTVKSTLLSVPGVTLSLVEINSGKTIKTQSASGTYAEINVADLPAGYYIVVIKNGSKELAAAKICKQ